MSETINDCKHEDCAFRRVNPYGCGSCAYSLIMGKSRGCKISECDKYVSAKDMKIKTKINKLYEIVWEIDEDGEVDLI